MKAVLVIFLATAAWASQTCTHEGEKCPIQGRCSYYTVCENGTLTVQKCGFGKKFSNETLNCERFWKVNCKDWASECEDGLLYNHPSNCRAYYSCFGNRLRLEYCPFLYAFNGEKCQFLASCPKGNECVAEEIRAADCSSYDICLKGKWVTKSCGFQRIFDPVTKQCVFGRCSKCETGTKQIVDGNCHKYKECDGKQFLEKSCVIGKMFNSTTGSCDWFYNVYCHPANHQCSGNYSLCADPTCKSYYTCENNKLKTESCRWLHKFDLEKGSCVLSLYSEYSDYNSTYLEHQCKENTLQPDPDCARFQICVKGKWRLRSCPKQQAFDVRTRMCLFEDEVQCSETSCLEGHNYFDKSNCYKYYKCINHKKVSTRCGLLSYFNPNTKQCEWYNPFFPPKCDKLKYQESSMFKIDEKCKDGTRMPAGNEMEYYECETGFWTLQQCPEAGHFDQETGKCLEKRKTRDAKCVKGTKMKLEGYCSKYLVCNSKGNFEDRHCTKGMNFDEEKKVCSENVQCSKYEPVPNKCDYFKVNGNLKKCRTGDRFDYLKQECVDFAMAHCLKTCPEGERKHHMYDCSKYYECDRGKFVERSCGKFLNFDWKSKKCVYFGAACKYESADCKTGDKKPGSDCKSYLECIDKHYKATTCSYFKSFNKDTSSCEWYWRVSCEKPSFNVLVQTYCTEGDKERVTDTCRQYRECVDGKWEKKSCSPCQNFNDETKTCEHVWKKPCAKDVTDPTEPTFTPPTDDPSSTPSTVECENGNVKQLRDNCKAYDLCKNNKWVFTKCWFWQKFDVESKQCVASYKAKCP